MITLKLTLPEALTLARSHGLVLTVKGEGDSWRVYYSHPMWVDSTPRPDTVSYNKDAWTPEEALRDSFSRKASQYLHFRVYAELK